jgi:hypothetical protein
MRPKLGGTYRTTALISLAIKSGLRVIAVLLRHRQHEFGLEFGIELAGSKTPDVFDLITTSAFRKDPNFVGRPRI